MSNAEDQTNGYKSDLSVSNGQGKCRRHVGKGHLCPVNVSGLLRKDHPSGFGHSYLVVLPRDDSYLAFLYGGQMCFAYMALIGCANVPLRLSLDRPDWEPRTPGWGGPQRELRGASCARATPPPIANRHRHKKPLAAVLRQNVC